MPKRHDLSLPVRRAHERYILKLTPPEYPHLVENEDAFITLARRRARMRTVDARIVRDMDDRAGVRRLALEDACQLLDLWPADKYNVTMERAALAVIEACHAPTIAARDVFRQVVFAWLIGNGGLHAKDLSVGGDLDTPRFARHSISGGGAASRGTRSTGVRFARHPAGWAPRAALDQRSAQLISFREADPRAGLVVSWRAKGRTMAEKKSKSSDVFTDDEKAALKESAAERKKQNSRRGTAEEKAAAAAQDVLDKIAELPDGDRELAQRVHDVVLAAVPELAPKTWYGMPAYYSDGKLLCFFQPASKFSARYSTFGFEANAALDDGAMWPTSWALLEMTPAVEKQITELVKRAVGES